MKVAIDKSSDKAGIYAAGEGEEEDLNDEYVEDPSFSPPSSGRPDLHHEEELDKHVKDSSFSSP